MTYETLSNVYMIAGIASLVMAVVSAILFFVLNIPEAIAFITGRTRKKGIEAINRSGSAGTAKAVTRNKKAVKSVKPAKIVKTADEGIVQQKGKTAHESADNGTMPLQNTPSYAGDLSNDGVLTTVLDSHSANNAMEIKHVSNQGIVFTEQPFVVEFEITYVYSNIVIGENLS